jgi:predicted ester cyclase
MTGITIYRLRESKIAEAWSNIDQLGLLQQLGALPPSPGS